tara:strand:- start:1232 stop:1399 length:168 start_codon:yes stop_codon:yes gene_type:complete
VLAGALEFGLKPVGDVMTPIDQAYMLEINDSLTFKKIEEILKTGFSRIPIYENTR